MLVKTKAAKKAQKGAKGPAQPSPRTDPPARPAGRVPPSTKKLPWDGKPLCGAKSRQTGNPCRLPAGFRTDHKGEGRCFLHGGRNQVKHGRYSTITRGRIRELLDHYENDPEPLNLLPEVKLLRALLTDFVERYEVFVDGLQSWHASFSDEYTAAMKAWRAEAWELLRRDPDAELPALPHPRDSVKKPRQILDVTAASALADKVGSMVDRIEKYTAAKAQTITLETLDRALEQVGVELVATLRKEVRDEALRARILGTFEDRWSSIHLDPTPARAGRDTTGHGPN